MVLLVMAQGLCKDLPETVREENVSTHDAHRRKINEIPQIVPKHAVDFIHAYSLFIGSLIYIYMYSLPVGVIQKCLFKCVMLKAGV